MFDTKLPRDFDNTFFKKSKNILRLAKLAGNDLHTNQRLNKMLFAMKRLLAQEFNRSAPDCSDFISANFTYAELGQLILKCLKFTK